MELCDTVRFSENFMNEYMNRTYGSYSEYKHNFEEAKLQYLIHKKYLRLLGKFIETIYPDLKFDIFIRNRNPKERKVDWYGMTYMELIIFDVISSPVYTPLNFEPSYRTPHYDGFISGESLFYEINSYLPEITKHLLIKFRPLIQPHIEIHNMDFYNIPEFECWTECYKRERIESYASFGDPYNNRFLGDYDRF